MSVFCESLPSRLEWRMFGGDFSKYEEALYEVFKRDFLRIPLTYMGKPVDIIHEKYYNRNLPQSNRFQTPAITLFSE